MCSIELDFGSVLRASWMGYAWELGRNLGSDFFCIDHPVIIT